MATPNDALSDAADHDSANVGPASAAETGGAVPADTGALDVRGPSLSFAVVGIGASAGGLYALRRFFSALPADSGMAFVVVQHLEPTKESLMAELLARYASIPVVEITDVPEGTTVEPNHAYLILPNRELTIRDGRLHLAEFSDPRGQRRPIDTFLRSLARDQRERSIGIILSGTGTNGSEGVKAVKPEGGLILAQTPDTAEFDGMPQAAIRTGLVDAVLPPEKMPEFLGAYVAHPYVRAGTVSDPEEVARQHLQQIMSLLSARVGHDFSGYKTPTVMRRMARRMGLLHIEHLADYLAHLWTHPEETQALVKDLLINVTNFFRDSEAWAVLQHDVIAPLVRDRDPRTPIRAWVAGCSSGEEAYSLAMVLIEELDAARKPCGLKIFATDTAPGGLDQGRNGVFPDSIEVDVSPERLGRFFDKQDGSYAVKKELRDAVVFAPQNVLTDPPFSHLDLITCRNMLMYLNPDVQQKVIGLFHFALKEGGCLFLGSAETPGRREDLFSPVSKRWRLYRRGRGRHQPPGFPVLPSVESHAELRRASEHRLRRRLDPIDLAHRTLQEHFAVPAILIDEQFQCLFFSGDTEAYLAHPPGMATHDLRQMVRSGLKSALRTVVARAREANRQVSETVSFAARGEETKPVTLIATPVRGGPEAAGLMLISFHEPQSSAAAPAGDTEPPDGVQVAERQVEEEVRSVRQELEGVIGELESANEELKSSNEEVISINEELQSTNEELETSKEEMQALNEELNTVNQQLEVKVDELQVTNNDMQHLLANTDIGMLFLDTQFHIRRFTPTLSGILRLRPMDEGRPLSELAVHATDPQLLADAEQVLAQLVPLEKELQTGNGSWYLRRVLPYRTEDNRIAGVVITFTEFTQRKRAEDELQQLNETLEQRVAQATRAVRLMQDVAVIANEAQTVREALSKALDRICRELHWPVGHAWLPAKENPDTFVSSDIWSVAAPEKFEDFMAASEWRTYTAQSRAPVGKVIASRRAYWSGDIARELERPFVERLARAGMRSTMAFPLLVGERLVAVLEFFTQAIVAPDDFLMAGLSHLSPQLGRVIERNELEQEVADRTDQERRRIAQELHDGVAQQLTGLEMLIESCRPGLVASALGERVTTIIEQTRKAKRMVRDLSHGLMPVEVVSEGLMHALGTLCREMEETSGTTCRFECSEVAIEDNAVATHLYRIAQEALHNAIKHAEASEIVVHLSEKEPLGARRAGTIELSIQDDGTGKADESASGAGFGTKIMRYRANVIGASLEVISLPGEGTTVRCIVPLSAPVEPLS